MEQTFQTNLLNLRVALGKARSIPFYLQMPSITHYPLTNLQDLANKIRSLYRTLDLGGDYLSEEESGEIERILDESTSELLVLANLDREKHYDRILAN